jgi:hypothetical protein
VAGDVLDHHDRVVDEQAQRDDEPDDAQLVDGEPEQVEDSDADRQGQWDRHHDDEARPRPEG